MTKNRKLDKPIYAVLCSGTETRIIHGEIIEEDNSRYLVQYMCVHTGRISTAYFQKCLVFIHREPASLAAIKHVKEQMVCDILDYMETIKSLQ